MRGSYADLRRESLHAGGIPVAVRHIESIIRTAEAHARMHLRWSVGERVMCRDHVNDDDVDVAIATMLESFINSQKHAVKMALRKTFRSYIVRPEDNFGLILYQLTELVREKMLALQLNSTEDYQGTITITIPVRELEEKVQQMGISGVTSFLDSPLFKENKFSYDARKKEISRVFMGYAEE